MKIFIDTANTDKIREINSWGILDGVTTNPSLIAKEGKDLRSIVKEISGIVRGMGNGAEVLSPTYPLLNIYEGDINVHHFDWYRLESVEEFYEAALDDYFPGDGVALVEWASALDMEAESALRIAIEKEGEGRRIDLRAPDISRWEGIC